MDNGACVLFRENFLFWTAMGMPCAHLMSWLESEDLWGKQYVEFYNTEFTRDCYLKERERAFYCFSNSCIVDTDKHFTVTNEKSLMPPLFPSQTKDFIKSFPAILVYFFFSTYSDLENCMDLILINGCHSRPILCQPEISQSFSHLF